MPIMHTRLLVFSSAVGALLLLFSYPSAFARSVEGDHEVMLVDAQLTKTSAEKGLQEIKETKKPRNSEKPRTRRA